jgi:hypothetical protein
VGAAGKIRAYLLGCVSACFAAGLNLASEEKKNDRWGAAIWRAQTQVLLGRLKYALPGWEEAESRRAADTAAEASCRSHASGSGARGFDAGSWGAGYGGDVGRADRYAGG